MEGNKMPKPTLIFGTVGSPLSTPRNPGGTVGGIRRLAELGLGTLELAWVRSVRVSEEKCAEIKATAQACGLVLSVHAPYFINLNGSPDEWPRSCKRLMDAAHFGNLAGATDIIFHPGSYFGGEPRLALDLAVPRLRQCVSDLRAAGNPVRLRPETMGKSIDFAHLHARPGDGSVNTYAEWQAILKLVKKRLGAAPIKRLHIHLSGIEYGPKGEKHHLPLKESDLKYRQLFQALRDAGAAGRVLCESPKMEDDALVMKKEWEKIQK
jgi:deoxyribonuclease-4